MSTNPKHNTSGFQVPKDYFENLEKKLLDQLEQEQEVLPSISKLDSGFEVPPQYFDTLEEELLNSVLSKRKVSKVRTLFSSKNMIYVVGVAALVVIAFLVYAPQKNTVDFDTLAFTEIEASLEDGSLSLSSLDVEDLIAESPLIIEDFDVQTLSTEQLEEYLSEDQIDDDMIQIE